jgi:hypothetical protein
MFAYLSCGYTYKTYFNYVNGSQLEVVEFRVHLENDKINRGHIS